MPPIPDAVREILRDPVSLVPLSIGNDAEQRYLDLRRTPTTAKQRGELRFAVDDYTEPDGRNYRDRLPHMVHPEIGEDQIVVDIGCGPRSFLGGLAGHHVFVDDILGEYVEQLDATYAGLPIQARTELLPFADASIDVVYSVNMLDHVDDMPTTMAELARVLKPGGRIALQTYFNSHPLLPTEPGVFDRYFFDRHVLSYFDADDVATHCVQSPTISDYYTMGIMTATLTRRSGIELPDVDREAIASTTGPQSLISEALAHIETGELDGAGSALGELDRGGLYEFHGRLLDAKLAIARGDYGAANDAISEARRHPRAHRNPYARLAIMELERERFRGITSAANGRANDANAARARTAGEIVELQKTAERQAARIQALEAGFERRAERILELDRVVVKRDTRLSELEGAKQRRDARILELDQAIEQRDARIDELGSAVAGRDERIRSLHQRVTNPRPADIAKSLIRLVPRTLRRGRRVVASRKRTDT